MPYFYQHLFRGQTSELPAHWEDVNIIGDLSDEQIDALIDMKKKVIRSTQTPQALDLPGNGVEVVEFVLIRHFLHPTDRGRVVKEYYYVNTEGTSRVRNAARLHPGTAWGLIFGIDDVTSIDYAPSFLRTSSASYATITFDPYTEIFHEHFYWVNSD